LELMILLPFFWKNFNFFRVSLEGLAVWEKKF